MKCLLTDRAGLTAYLRCPAEHHKRIRHSNFIERTFGVTRRRTKVIGPCLGRPAASPCYGPCWTAPPAAGAA
jgi:putative transposase